MLTILISYSSSNVANYLKIRLDSNILEKVANKTGKICEVILAWVAQIEVHSIELK